MEGKVFTFAVFFLIVLTILAVAFNTAFTNYNNNQVRLKCVEQRELSPFCRELTK